MHERRLGVFPQRKTEMSSQKTQAKERPIIFSAPMVRAILDGTKTQTRRVVKQQIVQDERFIGGFKLIGPGGVETAIAGPLASFLSPYGPPGDRLWVRENFFPIYPQDLTYNGGRPIEYDYAATYQHGYRLGDLIGKKKKWKPSIHMPRIASRITLEITGVRVERLQDISRGDAMAEGCPFQNMADGPNPCNWFAGLWGSINGTESWQSNPWVWVVEFKRMEGGAA